MGKISIDVPIAEVPGAFVEYEANDDEVSGTLFFAGIELAKDTFRASEANAEGLSANSHEKSIGVGSLNVSVKLEFWVRWRERKIVLIMNAKSPFNKARKEAWGDF